VQRVGRKVAPEGTAMDDWRIAVELAARLGTDLDLATVDEVTDLIAQVAPALAGVSSPLMKAARDGVVVPLTEHFEEVVLRTRDLSILAEDGSGVSWDPIKVEGVAAAEKVTDDAQAAGGEGAETPEGETDVIAETATAAAVSAQPVVDAPELHVWDGTAAAPSAPPRDAYALRLVVGRALYDGGRMVSETPLLSRMVPETRLRVNPSDLARIGVDSGGQVKVTSTRGSQVVAVEAATGVPAGVAMLAFSADGLGAALLIEAGQPVVDLRVESLR